MRIVIKPNDPDNRSDRVYRFPYETFSSGNIHILDTDMIEQVAELMSGDVLVEYQDGGKDHIENAEIVTIYPN